MQHHSYCNVWIEWILLLLLSLSLLICKSQKETHDVLDYTFYYTAHHYEFNYDHLIHQPNHLLIDTPTLKISTINASSLSYIVNDNIIFDFSIDTHYHSISHSYNTPPPIPTKRRLIIDKNEDTVDGGSWKLILQLKDARQGYFKSAIKTTGNENTHDQNKNTYSILGTEDATKYKDPKDGKYTFKLIYGNKDNSKDTLIWKQTSWPAASTTIEGFESVSIPNQREGSGTTFQGLALSENGATYLDGNGATANWWNSVGSIKAYKGGIPAYNSKIALSEELYVFRPPNSKAHKQFTKIVQSKSSHITNDKDTLVGDKRLTDFESAKTLCKYHYGDMVSIKNDEENTEVHKFCKEKLGGRCWIGLGADPNPKTWDDVKTWVDGSEYGPYKRWSPGEPNNSGGKEKCTEIWPNALWNDLRCDQKRAVICNKVSLEEYGNFVTVKKKMEWTDAELWCKEKYGPTAGLASIKGFSDDETIRNACGNIEVGVPQECWIGMTDTDHKFTKWSDDQLSPVVYSRWLEGNPQTKAGYDCVAMTNGKDGKFGWKNKLCSDASYFICDKGTGEKEEDNNPFKYVGCYRDTKDRAFRSGPKQWGFDAEKCFEACGEYKYFALQAKGWCSCENDFKHATKYGSYDKCPQDHLGGAWANDMYEIPKNLAEVKKPAPGEGMISSTYSNAYKWIGCYRDTSNRALTEGPQNWGYTIQTCYQACEGYKYFALQAESGSAESWCSCENKRSRATMYGKSHVCKEDHTGGVWGNDIFAVVPPKVKPTNHGIKFYRYWNSKSTDHFYTTNAKEIGTTRKGKVGRHGYQSEGVAGRLARKGETGTNLVNLYRYWNSQTKDHFYTTDAKEIDTTTVGTTGKYGYKSEGVAGKCFTDKNARPNLIPLYRYWKGSVGDHFYTTNAKEIGTTTAGKVGKHGYKSEGIQCYIYPADVNAAIKAPKRKKRKLPWKLVLRLRNVKRAMFSGELKTTGREHETNKRSDTYSVLGKVKPDNYQATDNTYTFKLVYGYPDGARDTLIWKQKSWPSSSGSIEGYTAVSIPKQRRGGTAFKGLAISNSRNTYLDGNGAAHAWWWNSVGTIKKYRDGIPAFNGKIAISEALYVQVPKSRMEQLKRMKDLRRRKRRARQRRSRRARLRSRRKRDRERRRRNKERRERVRGDRMRKEGQRRRKKHMAFMKRSMEESQKHLGRMKREIIKEMRDSFGKNNQKTVLLQKIDDLKRQQTDLELQHTLAQTKQQNQKEVRQQTREIMKKQMKWQRQKEEDRRGRMEQRQREMMREHEERVNEHGQLMNGLKGFLMAFSRLYRKHAAPAGNANTMKLIQRMGNGGLQEVAKRVEQGETGKKHTKTNGIGDGSDDSGLQEGTKRVGETGKKMNSIATEFNVNNRPLGYETQWTMLPLQQPVIPMPYVPPRPQPPMAIPPPLMPPIPPIPRPPRRRLTTEEDDHGLRAREVSKCIWDVSFGELCVTHASETNVVSFDVMMATHKRLKEMDYRNEIDRDGMLRLRHDLDEDVVFLNSIYGNIGFDIWKYELMDYEHMNEDIDTESTNNDNVVQYGQFDGLSGYVHHFIVYRFVFSDAFDTMQCTANRDDALPFKICLRVNSNDETVIYFDRVNKVRKLNNEQVTQYMKSLETLELAWINDQNWDEVMYFEERHLTNKCRNLAIIKLCMKRNDESNVSTVELKFQVTSQ
eukprot:19860_1